MPTIIQTRVRIPRTPSTLFHYVLVAQSGNTFVGKQNNSSVTSSVTSKMLPNVYKSCPKIISLELFKILTPLQKLPKNVGEIGNLGKLIVAKGL